MIYLKSPEEIEKMRVANRVVVDTHRHIREFLRPGVTTAELDRLAEEFVISKGCKPAFKGYRGFEHTLCISVNQEVVHGIPGKRILQEGDLVSIDCGVLSEGFYGDHAWSYPIGQIAEIDKKLLAVGKESLYKGIEKMQVGGRLFDISAAIQEFIEREGFSVVRDFVGHGVGRALHEEPQVPNFGKAGRGLKLQPGLVLALEPMVNIGTFQVKTLSDGWTVVTEDKKKSVHFEHSVALTEKGPEILSINE